MAPSRVSMLALAIAASGAQAESTDPIAKELQMIGDLQSKIQSEGADAQKVYDEFSEFCEDRSRELQHEIKTGKASAKDLEATIENEQAKQATLNAKIEELSGAIATDEADLAAATKIRKEENTAFVAEEKELVETIGTVERAIGILEKELNKGGASMMQLSNAQNVAQALAVMVEASSLNSADASQISAFIQNTQQSEDESESLGAPAAQVYENKSGGIIATMQDLYEKGEAQLEKAREAETKSRGEELKALATAKKVIVEATSGAAEQSYGFLQTSMSSSAGHEAVRFVRDLAKKEKSPALAQLASRMVAAIRSGANTSDPFAKVKDLIRNMIEKLNKEAEADATEKAFCDKEMAETEAKQSEKEAAIEKLTTEIDSKSAKSAKLKEEVATLQKELSELAKAQAEMDKLRAEQKAAFDEDSAEMKKGIKGVQLALKVLNDYYAKADKAHSSADGAGS